MFEELISAIKNHNIEEAIIILDRISDKELLKTDEEGFGALHFAAAHGQNEIIDLLLQKNHKLINQVDKKGDTALHQAAENGQSKTVELLLSKYPDFIKVENKKGFNSIHLAIVNGQKEIVELLMDKVLNFSEVVTKSSIYKATPLHLAIEYGQIEILKLLISKLPKLIIERKLGGETILHVAVEKGNKEILELLLDSKFPKSKLVENIIPYTSLYNTSILHLAVEKGDKEILELLFYKISGLNIKYMLEATNSNKKTILHLAVKHKHEEMIKFLLDKKPNLFSMEDEEGYTPLDIARNDGYKRGIELLSNYDTNTLTKSNESSPSDLYIETHVNHFQIIERVKKVEKTLENQTVISNNNNERLNMLEETSKLVVEDVNKLSKVQEFHSDQIQSIGEEIDFINNNINQKSYNKSNIELPLNLNGLPSVEEYIN